MKYLLYLFGFLPSLIWLSFYLKKDKHPEPNKMIIKVFFLGMLAAILAIFLEQGFQMTGNVFLASFSKSSLLTIFVGGALIEEFLKYFVVRLGVFRNKELDEPTDIVLYMIVAALGFAAMENILVLTNYHPILTSVNALKIMSIRFVSATLLHALCSGLFGYFIAKSFHKTSKRIYYFILGLFLATFLHGLYNMSIIKISGNYKFIVPIIILISLSCFVSYSFKKLKKEQSICLVK